MFDAQKYIETIQELERGAARMEVMSAAIEEADKAAEHYWRIYFRYEFIKESVFHDDNFKAIIMFPALLQIFDEHPELEDDTYDDVMTAFKWILENLPDYYQISRQEIESYYEEYEKRCKKYGYSLRVANMKKSLFYLTTDMEAARSAYQAFRECRRDSNSDCEACEINYDMRMALECGDEAEALRVAQPLLDGSRRCGEVPHMTYALLTKYYLYQGNLSEAQYYGKLCERYIGSDPRFLAESGYLLELYSVLRPAYGWKLFKRSIEHFVECRNPMMRMTFARGARRLLERVAGETEYTSSPLISPLGLERTEEGYRVADLIGYFGNLAEEQSALLDRRNGTDYYAKLLHATLPEPQETEEAKEGESGYAEHGLTERMSAIFMTAAAEMPSPEELDARLEQAFPEEITLLSHGIDENVLYVTLRYENEIFEAALIQVEIAEPLQARPQYGMEKEAYMALQAAPKKLMLRMDYCDNAMLSYRLVMKLLHGVLPGMLGVIDLMTERAYPAGWVEFAASFAHAVAPRDLVGLSISGAEESDEVWMTTRGMSCMGLRELELAGATLENFGYFADMLHYAGCECASRSMLPDAGVPFGEIILDGAHLDLTWSNADREAAKLEGSFAQNIEREIPSAMLMLYPDAASVEQNAPVLPTRFAPMQAGTRYEYPYSHSEFVRRIYLAKETFALYVQAVKQPTERTAVRLEFQMSREMQQKLGYGRELLWAENVREEDGVLLADVAETSEALPEISQGQTISVTADNITAWFFDPEGTDMSFTEEDAFMLI